LNSGLDGGAKDGVALPLALALILVLGLLAASVFEMLYSERMESLRQARRVQSELSAESGLSYALYRFASEDEPWRTSELRHFAVDSAVAFRVSSVQDGPFANVISENIGKDSGLVRIVARVGSYPDTLPALVLLDPEASLLLAGSAKIEGDVALKKGSIGYSTHYKMPASKDASFAGKALTMTDAFWGGISFHSDLTRDEFQNLPETDRCVFDGRDTLPSLLECSEVVIRGDAFCRNCEIRSRQLSVSERASLNEVKVFADTASLSGDASISGTIFSRDTLYVDLKKEQTNEIRLFVQGRKTGDASYNGRLEVQRLKSEFATLAFFGDNWDATMPGISVYISEDCNIRGALFVHGVVDIRGKFRGHALIWNFAFEESGTRWNGFFKDGSIALDTASRELIPDIFHFGGTFGYEKE